MNIFDSLATEYDTWFDEEGKLIFEIEVKAFRSVLPSLPKPWLEVGVGSGRFAQALEIKTGIDPSVKLLQKASSRGIESHLGTGENLPFETASFGSVFLILTLCFVNSPLTVLKEVKRVLKPDGKIVLGLILKDNPWGQYYMKKKEEGHRIYKNARFHNYREILELLAEAGFSLEKVMATLFQKPDEVKETETPREGYSPDAGFTVVVGKKTLYQDQT